MIEKIEFKEGNEIVWINDSKLCYNILERRKSATKWYVQDGGWINETEFALSPIAKIRDEIEKVLEILERGE